MHTYTHMRTYIHSSTSTSTSTSTYTYTYTYTSREQVASERLVHWGGGSADQEREQALQVLQGLPALSICTYLPIYQALSIYTYLPIYQVLQGLPARLHASARQPKP